MKAARGRHIASSVDRSVIIRQKDHDRCYLGDAAVPRTSTVLSRVILMVEMFHTYPDGEVSTSERCLGKTCVLVDLVDFPEFPMFGMPHYPPPIPRGVFVIRIRIHNSRINW